MNAADHELFKVLENAFATYCDKCESRDGIPWQAEGLMGKIQTYEGDLPQSGAYKPDMMPSTVDKYRKFYITELEYFAARMMFKVPKALRDYVVIEPIIRRKENVTQETLAYVCEVSVDQYKKRRGRAKVFLLAIARANMLKRPQVDQLDEYVRECMVKMMRTVDIGTGAV